MINNEKIMADIMFRCLESTSATNIRYTFKNIISSDVATMTPFIKDHIMELTEHGRYAMYSYVQAYIDVMDKKAPLFTPDEFIKIINTFKYDWTYIGRLAKLTTEMSPEFYMDNSELLSPYYKGLSRIHPEIKSDSNQLLYELDHMENFDITKAKNYSLGKEMQSLDVETFKNHIDKFSICKMMQKSNLEFLKKHHDYVKVLLDYGGFRETNQFLKKCIKTLGTDTLKQIITADEMFEYICDSVIDTSPIYLDKDGNESKPYVFPVNGSTLKGYRLDINNYGGKLRLQELRGKNLQDYIPFSENEKKNFYNNINALFDAYDYLVHKANYNYFDIPEFMDKAVEDYPKFIVEAGCDCHKRDNMRQAEEAFAKALLAKDYSAEFLKAYRTSVEK